MDNQDVARDHPDQKYIDLECIEDAATSFQTGPDIILPGDTVQNSSPTGVFETHLIEDRRRLHTLVRKVDIRLVLILALLYITAFLDRSNLGNVRDNAYTLKIELTDLQLGLHRWHEQRSGFGHRRALLDCHYDRKRWSPLQLTSLTQNLVLCRLHLDRYTFCLLRESRWSIGLDPIYCAVS